MADPKPDATQSDAGAPHEASAVPGLRAIDSVPLVTSSAQFRTLGALVIVLGVLAVTAARHVLAPVIVAAWFAGLTAPVVDVLARRIGGRHRVAAVVTVVAILLIVAPIVLIAVPVWNMIAGLVEQIVRSPRGGTFRAIYDAATAATPGTAASGGSYQRLIELGRQVVPTAAGLITRAMSVVSGLVLQVFVLAVSAYYFSAEGRDIMARIRQGSPLAPAHLRRLTAEFMDVARGLLVGGLLTSIVQGIVSGVIYAVVGVPRPLLFGVLTGVASMIPIVGSGLVWLPVAGLLLAAHNIRGAVIIALCGLLVISTVDNMLRPFFSRAGSSRIHPLLLLLGIFGGLQAFGGWGLILGPLILALFVGSYRLYADEAEARRVMGATASVEITRGP